MKNRIALVSGVLSAAVLMLVAAPVMARVDVAVNLGVPGYYVPAPVYVEQRPAYFESRPVYVEPRPVYVEQQPYYVERPYRQEWRERRWEERRHWRGRDRDHDGISNRYDRDRDGDGVPNRFDRRPNNPYRY